jgi:protein MpaA
MFEKPFLLLVFCTIFFVLLFSGCYEPVTPPELKAELQTEKIMPTAQYHVAGTSVQGRPIMYVVLGQGQDVTFILASIHGNEQGGTPLVQKLADHLQLNELLLKNRRVVLLPIANPDGHVLNSRFNANGVDLNRNFPTANRVKSAQSGEAGLSEPESCAIEHVIQRYSPDRVVSIHQVVDTGPEGLATLVPGGCIDYDGPGEVLAGHMAQYCSLPIQKLGARPGSLGSYTGLELGIPIITLELPYRADQLSEEIIWQRYGTALLAAIIYPDRPE